MILSSIVFTGLPSIGDHRNDWCNSLCVGNTLKLRRASAEQHPDAEFHPFRAESFRAGSDGVSFVAVSVQYQGFPSRSSLNSRPFSGAWSATLEAERRRHVASLVNRCML